MANRENFSYAFGVVIGHQIKDMELGNLLTPVQDFIDAVDDVLSDNDLEMEYDEAQRLVDATLEDRSKKMLESIKKNSEDYIKEMSEKAGVVKTASGLLYEVITEGDGKKPGPTSRVTCHYSGKFINGTEFDSSYKRNAPATFGLTQVIKGWTEGLQLMSVGSHYRFYIPYQLAYGERGAGKNIPPYSALVFDVELISID